MLCDPHDIPTFGLAESHNAHYCVIMARGLVFIRRHLRHDVRSLGYRIAVCKRLSTTRLGLNMPVVAVLCYEAISSYSQIPLPG